MELRTIGMHFLGRAVREQGHEVRLIPAQYVKPYVKTNKSDYIDAEAIAEAVARPTMRFVPIKTEGGLSVRNHQQTTPGDLDLTHLRATTFPGSTRTTKYVRDS